MSVDTFERRVQPFVRVVALRAADPRAAGRARALGQGQRALPDVRGRTFPRRFLWSCIAPQYRSTRTPGVYVRHRTGCPAGELASARCRCQPSWRGAAGIRAQANPSGLRRSGRALRYSAGSEPRKGADAIAEEVDRGPTFGELALRWWEGIESGSIGKRKGGGGSGYSETTLKGYERTLRKRLLPEFGGRYAAEITEVDWQLGSTGSARRGSRARGSRTSARLSARYTAGRRGRPGDWCRATR